MKRTRFLLTMFTVAAMFASCAPKGTMTLNATGDNLSAYEAAFGKYFDVTAVDATKSGFDISGSSSRYVVNVSNNMADIMPDENTDPGNRFIINIEDNETAVQIAVLYTIGGPASEAAVVRQNFNGSMTMDEKYNYIPADKSDKIKRAEEIAILIKSVLDKAEGKKDK